MSAEKPFRFVVRAAEEEDLAACLALDHSSTSDYVWQVEVQETQGRISYAFHTVRLPHPTNVTCSQDAEAVWAAWRNQECLLVAAGDGPIYGYLNMRLDRSHGLGWISDLVVDRSWRRRRVGTALLLQAREMARSHGLRRLIVETQTKNFPAIAFCQRHGLTLCGFNDQYYPNYDIALFFSQSLR